MRRQVRGGLQLQGGADQAHRQEDEVAVQKPVGQSRGSLQTEMLGKNLIIFNIHLVMCILYEMLN